MRIYKLQMTLYFSSLLLITTGVFYYLIFHPLIQLDPELYAAFTNHKTMKIPDTPIQKKIGVTKDIWVHKKDGIKHQKLTADSSEMLINTTSKEADLEEHFIRPEMWLTEESTMRHLLAGSGIFFYNKQLMISKDAYFTVEDLTEHPFETLPTRKAEFQTHAEEITCSLHPGHPKFTAKKMSAIMQPKGKTE